MGPHDDEPDHWGPLVDLAGLRRRLGDSGEAVNAVLATFIHQTPGLMAELEAARTRGDREQTRRLAHTIKGSLLWLGAEGAAAAAGDLERIASGAEGADTGSAQARLAARIGEILRELESAGHPPA